MVAALLLLSCTSGSDGTDTAPADTAEPASLPSFEPVWAAEDFTTELDAILAYGFPDPRQMQSTFEDFFASGDADCPGESGWMDAATKLGCFSESGWMYSGIGGVMEVFDEFDGTSMSSLIQLGDLEILGTEGQRLAIGGHWLHSRTFRPDQTEVMGDITGQWTAEGSGVPWLDETLSAWVQYFGVIFGEEPLLAYGGAWGGLSIGERAVHFEQLLFTMEGCEEGVTMHPSGTVSLLDPSGGWYRLTMDGACSPCGTLSFEGEVVAEEYCVDLSPLRESMSERLFWEE